MDNSDQSISKKRKMDNINQSVDDLLSDLPMSIIHCILARIPIGDAVRTCVLSSKWRYKWASLPHLVFDDRCVNPEGKTVITRNDCFKRFITNALFLHKGPVLKFGIYVNVGASPPDIDQWLLYLSRNEIREIILATRCYSFGSYPVHSCLYYCQKLTHLELSYCEWRPPLNFKGFSFLRILSLHRVEMLMPSTSLESLIATSPLLEKFTYYTLSRVMDSELRISAPKLKYFHLTSSFKEISMCAPLVDEVFVTWDMIQSPAEQLQQKSQMCTYAKFFGSFTNLKKLTAKRRFAEYLSFGIESYDCSLVFHHLKSIRLYDLSFEDKKQQAVFFHLIMGAPNLHELKISVKISAGDESDESDASGSTPTSFSYFGFPPNFTFKKLRVVKMKHVCGLPCEMRLIKYLLKSSPQLQTMNIYSEFELLSEVGLNLATKVLSYCRASPNAAIFLQEPPSYLVDL